MAVGASGAACRSREVLQVLMKLGRAVGGQLDASQTQPERTSAARQLLDGRDKQPTSASPRQHAHPRARLQIQQIQSRDPASAVMHFQHNVVVLFYSNVKFGQIVSEKESSLEAAFLDSRFKTFLHNLTHLYKA